VHQVGYNKLIEQLKSKTKNEIYRSYSSETKQITVRTLIFWDMVLDLQVFLGHLIYVQDNGTTFSTVTNLEIHAVFFSPLKISQETRSSLCHTQVISS
jgi:hypothetical protein